MQHNRQIMNRGLVFLAYTFSFAFLIILGTQITQAGTNVTMSQTVPTRTPEPTSTNGAYLPLILKPEEPTATPTATNTPLATETATNTPLPTATNTQAPPTATSTPSLPPASFNECQRDSNTAPNYPVKIMTVNKSSNPETVTLQNVSSSTVNLNGWIMCSITGNQRHDGISGSLTPGQQKTYPYTGGGFIWNNSSDDDGALYNSSGQLVSFWND